MMAGRWRRSASGGRAAITTAPDVGHFPDIGQAITWLATTSYDRSARIWDMATGRHRATLTGHTGSVTGVAIAPDGTWLATASRDQTVRIWESSTGGSSAVMRVDRPLTGCAWDPSGQALAAAGNVGLYMFMFSS